MHDCFFKTLINSNIFLKIHNYLIFNSHYTGFPNRGFSPLFQSNTILNTQARSNSELLVRLR